MATYPNARRNKYSDTLYRAKDIKPLDGDVLTDDGADSRFDQKIAELKKVLGKGRQEMIGSDSMSGGQGGDLVGNESIYNGKMDPASVADRQGKFRTLLMGVGQGGTVPAVKRDPINESLIPSSVKHPALLVESRGSDSIKGGQGGDVIAGSSADINKSLAAQSQGEPKSIYEQLRLAPASGNIGLIRVAPSSGTDVIARFGPAQTNANVPQRDRIAGYNPSEPAPAPTAPNHPFSEPPLSSGVITNREAEIRQGFAQDRANVDKAVNARRLPTAIPEGSQPDPYPLDTARRNQAEFDRVASNPNSTPEEIAKARQQMDQTRNIASGYRTSGFRSSETPEQSAEINRQLAAARQPLDPAGSFNTNAERNKWDALRGSAGNDEIAKMQRDMAFNDASARHAMAAANALADGVASGNPALERRIREQGELAMPELSRSDKARIYGKQEAEAVARGQEMNDRGRAMQQQNAEAEKNYNAQRAAQGEARRLGIPPAAAAMFDPTAQPGTAAYDANMGIINPALAIEQERGRAAEAVAKRAEEERRRTDRDSQFKAEHARLQSLIDDPTVPADRKSEYRRQQQMLVNAYIGSLAPNSNLPVNRPDAPNASNTVPPTGNAVPNANTASSGNASPGVPTPPAAPTPPAVVPVVPPNSITTGFAPRNDNSMDINAALASYRPNSADLWNAERDNWNALPAMASAHSNVYVPSAASWTDTNGNQKIDAEDQFGSTQDRNAILARERARMAIDEIMKEIPNINNEWGPESPSSIAKALMAKYGNQYGEDAVKWAVAKHMKDSGLLFTNRDAHRVVTDPAYWQEIIR